MIAVLQGAMHDRSGAATVEFALLFWILLFLTLGIIEFGLALFQWARAEKALQLGARIAVVSSPIAHELKNFSGKTDANSFGDSCRDATTGATQPYCVYDPNPVRCTSTGCNGYGFDAAAFNRIVDRMRVIAPWIQPDWVVVEYGATGLGFVGRPGSRQGEFNLVPSVSVRIENAAFPLLLMDDLFGLDAIPMPTFSTTLVGEDLGTVTED